MKSMWVAALAVAIWALTAPVAQAGVWSLVLTPTGTYSYDSATDTYFVEQGSTLSLAASLLWLEGVGDDPTDPYTPGWDGLVQYLGVPTVDPSLAWEGSGFLPPEFLSAPGTAECGVLQLVAAANGDVGRYVASYWVDLAPDYGEPVAATVTSSLNVEVTAATPGSVPEPGAFSLLLAGAAPLGLIWWRRRGR